MKTVRLKMADEKGDAVSEIEGTFTEEDEGLLRQYVRHMDRIRGASLLARGMPFITNMEWTLEKGMCFTCSEYTNPELHELLHVLRPVILESEAASFHKVSALLGRRFRDKSFAAHQKALRTLFEDGKLSMYMQITVGGQKLLDQSLLHTWLNGAQYHTDPEKVHAWEKLEASLKTGNARAIVITQLHSRVEALLVLEQNVKLVLESGHDV